MSVGLFRHPTLGETKKYILNNKYVLEVKANSKETDLWSNQYVKLKDSYLRNTQLKFYLLPEEVYVDMEAAYQYEQNTHDPMRIILYEHFVITLKEQLQSRIKEQKQFTKKELWFMLYALACGAMEMIQIREFTNSGDEIQINPETILLNEYGYVKVIGYYSVPFPPKNRGSFKAPENSLPLEALPQKIQICCSAALGRIVSSLVLLKEMDEFVEGKQKMFFDHKLLEELKRHEERLGILYNIIRMMIADNLSDRLMVSEVRALLLPYEEQILSLSDFTFDKDIGRESMIALFVNQ